MNMGVNRIMPGRAPVALCAIRPSAFLQDYRITVASQVSSFMLISVPTVRVQWIMRSAASEERCNMRQHEQVNIS